MTASKVLEKVLIFEELKIVQNCCDLSIWQMTVKVKVIGISIHAYLELSVPECQNIPLHFFDVQMDNSTFRGTPPSLRSWSTWLSVQRPPFSMAAFRTNLVAKPCKRQKVALEPFTPGTNYTLLHADCVVTAKIGKSCKMEFQLWSVWIEVSSGISHSHLSMSHFSLLQVNDCGII